MRVKGATAALTLGLTLVAGIALLPVGAAAASGYSGNDNGGSWQHHAHNMNADTPATIRKFKKKDPQVAKFVHNSYAYAVFPSVGEGAAIVGAAHGNGKVYEQGKLVGHASITKVNVGAQAGGKTFSEAIFFKDKRAFDQFRQGNYALSADASAVAVTSGAQATNDYEEGVAVFTMAKGGLMAGVSVGGQKFSYTPLGAGSGERSGD